VGVLKSDLDKFVLELNAFTDKVLPENLVLFHKKLSLQVLRGVVMRTPVDTGRARGNWQLGVETVPTGEVTDFEKPQATSGEAGKKKRRPQFNAVGKATFERGLANLAALKPFSVVFITNNVPYIEPLENGHSKQAPNGMVKVTLEQVRTQFATEVG